MWVRAFHGNLPDAEVGGMADAILSSFAPTRGYHVVNTTIIGAHHTALRQHVSKETFSLINQLDVEWITHALLYRTSMFVAP